MQFLQNRRGDPPGGPGGVRALKIRRCIWNRSEMIVERASSEFG